MDLSPHFQATHTAFSRVKRLLAASTKDRLVIRTADSLQVLHSIKLAEPLTSLAFSASAQHLLAVTSGGTVSVYDCDSAERQIVSTASAGEGTAASWLSSELIGVWDNSLRSLTVYSVERLQELPVKLKPKLPSTNGWAINSRQPQFMALVQRTPAGQDMLAIYDLSNGDCRQARLIRLPSQDAADINWSPCGRYIAAWESCLEDSLYVITPDGRPLCHYRVGGSTELGIRHVAWDPQMRYLAIGDYSSQIHILTTTTWYRLLVFSLAPQTASSQARQATLHTPPASEWKNLRRNLLPYSSQPTPVPSFLNSGSWKRPDASKAPIRAGITQLAFTPTTSISNQPILAARDDCWPHYVFLYSLEEQAEGLFACILHDQPVRSVEWRPEQESGAEVLAATTSSPSVTFWFADGSPGGRAELMQSGDPDFCIRRTQWNAQGDAVLLCDANKFSVGTPVLGPDDP